MYYSLMDTYLSSLVELDRFWKLVDSGHISNRVHPDDESLAVFSYTPKVQFSGLWTPETRLARGLIVHFTSERDGRVVGRGLPKFFTIDQITAGDWASTVLIDDDENVTVDETPEIPWDEPAHVANKLNGALGLGYLAPDHTVAVATKGSFGSTEALIGTRLLKGRAQHALRQLLAEGETPLFELITPERPHPVDYGELEDLIFLGTVVQATGEWLPATDEHPLVVAGHFRAAEVLPHRTLREAMAAPYEENTEGMVVTVADGQLFKVKSQEYKDLRRAFYAVTEGNVKQLVGSMGYDELMTLNSPAELDFGDFGDLFAGHRRHLLERLRSRTWNHVIELQNELKTARKAVRKLLERHEGDRGAVARSLSKDPKRALMLATLAHELSTNDDGSRVVKAAKRTIDRRK